MTPLFIIVDLFCGAGGYTEGCERARVDGVPVCKVIVGINHDAKAIESHSKNHPETMHMVEDVRHVNLVQLAEYVRIQKLLYPNAQLVLHGSLECTNFSDAKGGLPRDADSRSLADHLNKYVVALDPDYITIENVVEFMAWGPLTENGKPESRTKGVDFIRWKQSICELGYVDDWAQLNSANYGAYTSRNRLFGMFAKHGLPIVWPVASHAKKNKIDKLLFGETMKPWQPVREVLDFDDKGTSIFERKKPLSDKTLERIYAGLIKFIAGGKENFILKYNSTQANGKVWAGNSTDDACPVISTQVRMNLVQPHFLSKYFSGAPEHKNIGVDVPAGTLKCKDNHALIASEFIHTYHGNGHNLHDVNNPSPTLTNKDTVAIVNTQQFMVNPNFNNDVETVDAPCKTLLASRKHYYLVNPQYFNNGASVDEPCFTIIARMDKKPPYIVQTEEGAAIQCYDTDSDMAVCIKQFMAMYGIAVIYMRMLRIPELKRIQGFGDDYILCGTETLQKKFIGNAVHPIVPQRWWEAMGVRVMELQVVNTLISLKVVTADTDLLTKGTVNFVQNVAKNKQNGIKLG